MMMSKTGKLRKGAKAAVKDEPTGKPRQERKKRRKECWQGKRKEQEQEGKVKGRQRKETVKTRERTSDSGPTAELTEDKSAKGMFPIDRHHHFSPTINTQFQRQRPRSARSAGTTAKLKQLQQARAPEDAGYAGTQ